MKLRYMVEYAMRDLNTDPHYEPIGVWVQGSGPGLDITMEYLPGCEDYAEDADWVLNRLVGDDVKSLPDDFLEYHRSTMSPYRGMRGEIVETEEYSSAADCVVRLLCTLPQHKRHEPPSTDLSP